MNLKSIERKQIESVAQNLKFYISRLDLESKPDRIWLMEFYQYYIDVSPILALDKKENPQNNWPNIDREYEKVKEQDINLLFLGKVLLSIFFPPFLIYSIIINKKAHKELSKKLDDISNLCEERLVRSV